MSQQLEVILHHGTVCGMAEGRGGGEALLRAVTYTLLFYITFVL